MMRHLARRWLLSAVLAAVLFTMSVPAVYGAGGLLFSLSSAEAEKGRLVPISLSAEGEECVSAFMAEVSYDSEVLEFRSASSDSELCVNSNEKGKLCIVYLCEDGVPCSEDALLMTFVFKAKAGGNTALTLRVWDAVNPQGEDIAATCESSAEITVNVSAVDNADSKESTSFHAEKTEEDVAGVPEHSTADSIIVDGKSLSTELIIYLSLLVLVLLAATGYACYRIGVNKAKEKIPLDKPDSKDSI